MQLERDWGTDPYVSNVNAPRPRPHHHESYYAAQTGYDALGLNVQSHDASGSSRDAQLGVWTHGSKRIRPNEYAAMQQEMTSRADHDMSTTQQFGRTASLAPPYQDQARHTAYEASQEEQQHHHQHPHHQHQQQQQQRNDYAQHLLHMRPLDQSQSVEDYARVGTPYGHTPSVVASSVESNGVRLPRSGTSPLKHSGQQGTSAYHTPRPMQSREDSSLDGRATPSQHYVPSESYAPAMGASHGAMPVFAPPMVDWSATPYTYGAVQGHSNMQQDPYSLYGRDASLHLKLQSLAVLDNLATQIIMNLANPSLAEIEQLTKGEDNEDSQAYSTRKSLFDQTRKVYIRDSPFIDAIAIQLFTPAQQEIIRKANKATFISSVLEGHDVSFYDLNEYFLDIFVPLGQRLLKWQGGIFLELKTQVYISALMNTEGPVNALLDELFPSDMEERLTARHPDAPNLAPSEQDFIERAKQRKQYLQAEPAQTAMHNLPRKYEWQDFAREFVSCISKNVDAILNPPNRSQASLAPQPHGDMPAIRTGSATARLVGQVLDKRGSRGGDDDDSGRGASSYNHYDIFRRPCPVSSSRDDSGPPAATSTSPPLNTETRTAKAGKPTSNSAPRQPWKQEEEDALMAGLNEVKGPHWSQILSLYGRGGSISEVLKDRNQIQLKDKARNLKLYYLKMGNEVPACLQGVTGELRKRGGARVRAALGLGGPPASSAAGPSKSAGAGSS